jgi:deazaflavin-dependent oxidoreductase (nitroreductase family)
MRPRGILRLQWGLHRLVYRRSGGRIGTRVIGMPVLELTTTGRRSGEPRRVLLTYLDHEGGFLVAASNAGADRDPAWWRNLVEAPEAAVRADGESFDVRARPLQGEERAAAWDRFVAADAGYGAYDAATDRDIPVVLLERR